MAKVFVPMLPSRYDSDFKQWVPTMNIDPARLYGEIFLMLPPQANRLHTAPLVQSIKDRMIDFTDQDYLVAVGDPTIFAVCACVAAKKTGGQLRMLKWDRLTSTYIPLEINL